MRARFILFHVSLILLCSHLRAYRLLFTFIFSCLSFDYTCKMASTSSDEVAEEVKGILAQVVDDVGKGSAMRQLVIGGTAGW